MYSFTRRYIVISYMRTRWSESFCIWWSNCMVRPNIRDSIHKSLRN